MTRRGTRVLVFGLAACLLSAVLASCSSDNSSSSKKTPTTSGGQAPAQVEFTGAELAVADYLESLGHEYAGDCAQASLPRDRGRWCSTLVKDGDEQRVYEVGPVGKKAKLIVTVDSRGAATLTPGLAVNVAEGNVGAPRQLTREELLADAFITTNIVLDQLAGIGNGLADIPGTPAAAEPPPDGGGGIPPAPPPPPPTTVIVPGPGQYPPNGELVVDEPNIVPAGIVVFRGGGCLPNETLTVLFDGTPVATVAADAQGNFSGQLKLPVTTSPGAHVVTVRGSSCELNVNVNVAGALAFTGSPDHTRTIVLVGVLAIMVGLVLVVGARRRRGIRGARAGPPA